MKKLKIDMLSRATSVPAQGVGSVYIELMRLLEKYGKEDFDVRVNELSSKMDIYHIHSVNYPFYRMMKKKRITICFVHFMPDTLVGSVRLPRFAFGLFKRYVVSFYKKAKEIVVVNPSFKQELVEYGLDENKITYIPNFVSQSEYFLLDENKRQAIRKRYNLPSDSFVVLGVGQVQTRKGILDFIRMSEENPDMYFVWAGGFSFKNITDGYYELKREMAKKRKNLVFLGIIDRDKMNEIYNMADAFVLPSYNELFPMALLENCSVGKPYIVRDLDLYKDILVDEYLKAKDVEGFSSLLRKLKNDKQFYDSAISISKSISEKYGEENLYKMWRDYYWKIYKKYHNVQK